MSIALHFPNGLVSDFPFSYVENCPTLKYALSDDQPEQLFVPFNYPISSEYIELLKLVLTLDRPKISESQCMSWKTLIYCLSNKTLNALKPWFKNSVICWKVFGKLIDFLNVPDCNIIISIGLDCQILKEIINEAGDAKTMFDLLTQKNEEGYKLFLKSRKRFIKNDDDYFDSRHIGLTFLHSLYNNGIDVEIMTKEELEKAFYEFFPHYKSSLCLPEIDIVQVNILDSIDILDLISRLMYKKYVDYYITDLRQMVKFLNYL